MKVLTREFEVEFEDINKTTNESFKNTKKFIVEFEQTKDFTKKFAKKFFRNDQIGLYLKNDLYVDILNEKLIKKDLRDVKVKLIANYNVIDFYDVITDDKDNLLLLKYRINIKCKTDFDKRTTTKEPIKCKICLEEISPYQCYIDFEKNTISFLKKGEKKSKKAYKNTFQQTCFNVTNFKDILKNPYIQKTSFDKYYRLFKEEHSASITNFRTLTDYLSYRKKFPVIDSFIQKSYKRIISYIVYSNNIISEDKKDLSLNQLIPLPKQCLNYVLEQNFEFNTIECIVELYKATNKINLNILQQLYDFANLPKYKNNLYYHQFKIYELVRNIAVNYKIDINKILNYIQEAYDHQACKPIETLEHWEKYLFNCKELNYKKYDKYPKSLKKATDLTKREVEQQKDKIIQKKFKKAMQPYKDLNLEDDKYCIVLPKTPEDLIKEGDNLKHCVGYGGYAEKIANNNSIILFVRDKKNPRKSLYTLEVSTHTKSFLQFRGMQNCVPAEDAFVYVNKVIEQVKALNVQ